MKVIYRRWFLALIFTCVVPMVCLAQQDDVGAAASAETAETVADKWQHLDALVETINRKRHELTAHQRELADTQDPAGRERLETEIDQISADLDSLQTAWEMLATGGANLNIFGVKVDKAFNWREELQSVFEPLLSEMKRLTERPRRIEQLRQDQNFYQRRLDVAKEAVASIEGFRQEAPTAALKKAFATTEDRWRERRDDLANSVHLIELELQQMLSGNGQSQFRSLDALKELLTGRVLNLLLAIAVMVLVYLLLRGAAQLYNRRVIRTARRRGIMMRLGNLLFFLFTTLLVLLAGMTVLYMRGDWVLLGLFIIILIGAAWALQRSLPRFVEEAKLMLNLGAVREGERLIYRELPWRVKSLGFYCTLVNPLLDGGTLLLPLRDLVGFNSREYVDDEPWFPTQNGDYVVLDNGSYGQVMRQTPEVVQLRVLGAIKTWRASAFIDQNPRNLSQQGFTLVLTFGLDYQHQPDITTTVRETLEQELQTAIEESDMVASLTSLAVEFSQAGASSLDLAVITSFNGDAADRYFPLQRLLQRLAVEACNRHGWVIPFNQITVHQA
jgi:hypothetical protein